MSARGSASRFLGSALRNGVGRYVCQLKRVSLMFSKNSQNSLGLRDFIEDGLVEFAQKNPSIVLYVSPQSCRIPKLRAEYLNGHVQEEMLTNKSSQQISELITRLSNQSGLEIIRIRKPLHTDSPSIQGQWTPLTHHHPTLSHQHPPPQHPSTKPSSPHPTTTQPKAPHTT